MDEQRIKKYAVIAKRKDGEYEDGSMFDWRNTCDTLGEAIEIASRISINIPDKYDYVDVRLVEFVTFGFGTEVVSFHADCSLGMVE